MTAEPLGYQGCLQSGEDVAAYPVPYWDLQFLLGFHRCNSMLLPLGFDGCISLWDVRFGANTERFQGSVPLSPHLCPLSVPKGGVCGVYSESPCSFP